MDRRIEAAGLTNPEQHDRQNSQTTSSRVLMIAVFLVFVGALVLGTLGSLLASLDR
jgi:hypothetical protein